MSMYSSGEGGPEQGGSPIGMDAFNDTTSMKARDSVGSLARERPGVND
jgi:hypothetical protein